MLSLMMAAERHGNAATENNRGGFDKLGPVIPLPDGYTGHVRDPKVWKHNSQWYMVLGAQDKEKRGKVLLYSSVDLYTGLFMEKLLVTV